MVLIIHYFHINVFLQSISGYVIEMKSVCDNSRATSQETQSNTASVTVQMMDVKHNNLDSVMKS